MEDDVLFGRNLKESRGRQQKGVKCKEFGILLESKSNFAWRDALKVDQSLFRLTWPKCDDLTVVIVTTS